MSDVPADVIESARRLATDNGQRAAEDLEVVLDYVLRQATVEEGAE